MKNQPQKASKANFRNAKGSEEQNKFMSDVVAAYRRCAVTQTSVYQAMQAAHIIECKNATEKDILEVMDVTNGILLRRDWHVAFDKQLWAINPEDYSIVLGEKMKTNKEYAEYDGKKIKLPKKKELQPNVEALKLRYKQFLDANK
jgi:predicted restriction endonuclease